MTMIIAVMGEGIALAIPAGYSIFKTGMKPLASRKQLKPAAIACLCATIVLCIVAWMAVWQTRYQLVSPLVPDHVVASIQRPYKIAGISMLPVVGISLLAYRQKKYAIVIVLGIVAAITWRVYLTLA
jgi:hypothetical protein